MQRSTRRIWLCGLVAFGLNCAGLSVWAADKPINLRLGTLAPRGTSYHKSLLAMGEKWRQESGGAIRLTIFPDGTQGSEADMVGLMQTGNLDACLLTAVGLSEIEPSVNALQSMPMMFHSLDEVDYLSEKLSRQLEQRLQAKGYMVLFWSDSGWVRFFTKTPILHPDDLRKLKVFSWAGYTHEYDLWKSTGFSPVALETAAIPQALMSGTIDAVPMPPFFALAGQLDTQAKYMLELNWAPLIGGAVVRKKSWERVPAAMREAMLKDAAETGKQIKANGRAENESSVAAMSKRGLKVQKVSPEVELEWRAAVEKIHGQVRGKTVSADMFDETQRLLKDYRATIGGKSEMSGDVVAGHGMVSAPGLALPRWRRFIYQGENLFTVAALATMMILPVVEILLRSVFKTGISGSSAIVQHLTLIVGMLGGAIAARDGRLLALSPAQTLLKGRAKIAAHIFSSGFAAAISVFLCVASVQYVMAMKPLGKVLVYGIPVWTIQLFLPLGFGLIALRLFWRASEKWTGRILALALAAAVAGLAIRSPVAPDRLMVPALVALGVATLLGAPVFTALGGAALILFWGHDLPVLPVPLKHYSLTTNDMLPSIPIFTLAGYFLAEGGASQRLVRVFQALVGQFRGGPAIVTALVCAFFTSFTGGSGVTILALGGVLMPVLLAARYSERAALGLLTGAGSLGMLFPPCLPLILYAIVANHSARANLTIKDMFLGGIGPGILLVVLTAWWGIRQGPKQPSARTSFSWSEAGAALWDGKWEMLIPVVAIVSLFSVPTNVEAAALTATYAFLVATVIHRDLHPIKDLPRVITECALLVGGVLLILGVALGFTHYLVDAQIPDRMVEWSTGAVRSKWLFLLGLNVVLLFVGGLIEIYAAIVVFVPLLVPLGVAFGLDPVHLGIIFLANMELGFLAPPVGLNLLLSSYRFNKPMIEVTRAVIPILLVLLLGVLLITYFPPLTTFLPRLFK